MTEQPALQEDESWGTHMLTFALDVADVLRASGATSEAVAEAIDLALADLSHRMDAGEIPDFFVITEHPTLGTTYHVTLSFLPDKFRGDLTSAANELLIRDGHPETVSDTA